MPLGTLLRDDRIGAIRRGIDEANKMNPVPTVIDADAEELVSSQSEGYPSFVQQFAYSAFDEDSDNHITIDDVRGGIMKPGGGLHQLGTKYFHDLYFEQINSDAYRNVLRVMADGLDNWITKKEIQNRLQVAPHILNNALRALRTRNIIVRKSGSKGIYKLPTKSFAVWIKVFTQSSVPMAAPLTTGDVRFAGSSGHSTAE